MTQQDPVHHNTVAGQSTSANSNGQPTTAPSPKPVELGGPKGPEPTRFGDWERKGRCVDF